MRKETLALVLAGCWLSAGCGLFQRRGPQPPVIIMPQPPLLFPAPPPPPEAPPELLAVVLDPAPSDLGPDLSRIAAPRVASERRENSEHAVPGSDERKPAPTAEPPQLTQSLTPTEQAEYRRRTQATLASTQQDLRLLMPRLLNSEGAATRAQASEYVAQATEALNRGDLVRALTLAQKAETLTRFLLGQ